MLHRNSLIISLRRFQTIWNFWNCTLNGRNVVTQTVNWHWKREHEHRNISLDNFSLFNEFCTIVQNYHQFTPRTSKVELTFFRSVCYHGIHYIALHSNIQNKCTEYTHFVGTINQNAFSDISNCCCALMHLRCDLIKFIEFVGYGEAHAQNQIFYEGAKKKRER